ncbi:tetratricopeptide repeat protein [Pseudoduganella sp. OTU4001]|uniref:tetratricopeptide repeat protein n=1 Tax=Pseudoduganella sp. OTU4001 TaxID=3043854 RepID=UPI00313F029C
MRYPALIVACAWLCAAASAAAKPYCGDLNTRSGYGPFDYRTASQVNKDLVEGAHLTDDVRRGIKGSSGQIGADLQYTLVIFPNHPQALNTLIMLAARAPGKPISGMTYPIECWFERAVRFQPDDASAWTLFANYLYGIGQGERGMPMLQKAAELDPDNPSINYNLGLAYAKQRQYDKALPYAHKAYQQGFPLPGLKQLLVSAKKWTDPPALPAPAEDADPQPAAAAPTQQP